MARRTLAAAAGAAAVARRSQAPRGGVVAAAAAAAAVSRYLVRYRVEVTAVALAGGPSALVAAGVWKAQCRQAACLTSEPAHGVAGSAARTRPGRLHLDRRDFRCGDPAFD